MRHRPALLLLVALGLWLAPTLAPAQTITFDTDRFRRANEDNTDEDPLLGDPRRKDASGTFGGINRDECLRGEIWRIKVTVDGASTNDKLYLYTGHTCDAKTSRTGSDIECRRLVDIEEIGTSTSTPFEWEIPADEIAYIADTAHTCEGLSDSVRIWAVLLQSESDDSPAAAASYPSADIIVDTTPPAPPTDVQGGPGEQRVELEWTAETEGQHYYVACQPLPGDQGLTPSGDPTFGADGQETCASDLAGFTEGVELNREWRCDQGRHQYFADGTVATDASIDGLENGVQYHLAVVTVDDVGNPSVLSNVVCSTPQPVDDFFELYRDAGGGAGGGVCAASPGRPAGSGWMVLVVVALAGGALVRRRRVVVAAALAALLGTPSVAAADGLRYLQDDYRSPQNFALEIRGGPYYADVDDEFDGAATPFQDSFEDHSRLRIGFEVDWQALKTPIGTLGIGIAPSLIRYVGTARFQGSGEKSSEETTLTVMPIVALAVARFDFAVTQWQIPLVPYVKLGFATYLWFAEDGSGTARADGGDGSPDAILGSGRTHGFEVTGGLAFLLDFIEPQAARKLDSDMGVNHSYLFFELLWANIDGFGAQGVMNLGDTTWNTGLLLEM